MSNRKIFCDDEGIGRIWKNTLAQTVDSAAGPRNKKDISRHNHDVTLRRNFHEKDKVKDHDDLDAANIQAALQNIRSLPGSGHNSHGSFQTSHTHSDEESSGSKIKNIVVQINNDNTSVAKCDQLNDESKKNPREGRQVRKDLYNPNPPLLQTPPQKDASHRIMGSKRYGGDKAHIKRNDEANDQTLPPRLRKKKNEEIQELNGGKYDQEKPSENAKPEKVVVLDMKDGKETQTSMLDDLKELDAYDRWKLKRQNGSSTKVNISRLRTSHSAYSSSKTNEGIAPLFKSQRNTDSVPIEKIESVTVYSSKVKDSETGQDNIYHEKIKEVLNHSSSEGEGEYGLSDSYDAVWSEKVMQEHALKHQSLTPFDQNSAMDKIQNLFQAYISPVADQRGRNCTDSKNKRTAKCDIYSEMSGEKENDDGIIEDSAHQDIESNFGSGNEKDMGPGKRDVTKVPNDHQESVQDMSKNLEGLLLTEEKHIYKQNVESDTGILKNGSTDDHLQYDPSYKLKPPPNIQLLVKSPASIPSGFSSDYDVGIMSQSETEEDDESPHPCAANLFPCTSIHNNSSDREKHQEQNQSASTPSSQSQMMYGNQPPMPPHQLPYLMPPWLHPYYNHPDPFRQPYHQMPSHPPHYPGFTGMDSSPFPGQQSHAHTSQSHLNQSTKCDGNSKNKLIIPAEKFSDSDSINKVIDFVAAKKEDWDNYMNSKHGKTEPVDVVISVTLAGVTTENEDAGSRVVPNAYSAHNFWQYYNMYSQPSMGYNYNSFWPQPFTDEKSAYSMHYMNASRTPFQVQQEGAVGENLKENRSAPDWKIEETDSITDLEDMKRRALFENDRDSSEEQVTKKRIKDHANDGNNPQSDASGEKSTESTDKKLPIYNSVSSFLNPNDLKNEWEETRRKPLSSSSAATKQSKYELVSSQLSQGSSSRDKERDRSPHSATKFQQPSHRHIHSNQSFDDEEENYQGHRFPASPSTPPLDVKLSTNTLYDKRSVCVVETNVEKKRPLEELKEDYKPITGKWAEICPEPEPTVDRNALSRSSSTRDMGTAQNRRRSDSVISYGSDDRSPFAKDYRLCRTPGLKREASNAWKKSLMTRSRNYTHKFIDTHCHLDFLYHRTKMATIPFKKYVEDHADSFPANYGGCIAVFCNPKVFSEYTQAYGILALLPKENNVWVAIGCHPKSATDFTTHHLLRMRRFLVDHPRVVALGEIGLDYSGTFRQHEEVQKAVFVQQLRLALELKLPLVIHCRDAYTDCLEILKKHVPKEHKIHLHCFTRHFYICKQWMDYFPNLFVGFTPLITTLGSARDATEAAAKVSLDRLLLETDAPYFVPNGVQLEFSHPGLALFTAERIAELKNLPVDTVLEACRENTRVMYGV